MNLRKLKTFDLYKTYKKDIPLLIFSVLVTWYFSKMTFKGYQKQVAKEALQSIATQQKFCDASLRTLNEKLYKIESTSEIRKDLVVEYFDNLRNQMSDLKEVISNSRLTWSNVFPDEARFVEKKDRESFDIIQEVQKLSADLASSQSTDSKAVELRRKIEEKKVQLFNLLKSNEYKNANYPSAVATSDTITTGIVVLPTGKTMNIDYWDLPGLVVTSPESK